TVTNAQVVGTPGLSLRAGHGCGWTGKAKSILREKLSMKSRIALFVAAMVLALRGESLSAQPNAAGAVYVATNAAAGNSVVVFSRSASGALTLAGSFATGGSGTGTGLGNQGGLILSRDGEWLFVVNAGSDDVSVFQVRPDGLKLTDKVASGGKMPVSVTFDRDVLYVLNAGGGAGT